MSPEASPVTYNCVVCHTQAEAAVTAECNWCNGRFHLNQRNDIEAKDCGQVWVDEQFLALQFACNNCLAGTDRALAPPEQVASSARSNPSVTIRPRRYKKRSG